MTRTARGLIPLYAASTLLVVGEGSFQLLTPPYMHGRHLSSVLIGVAVSAYGLASLVVRLPAGAFYRSHRAWTLIAETLQGAVQASLRRAKEVDPTAGRAGVAEHRDLVAALRARDAEGARRIMTEHLGRTALRVGSSA